MRRASYRGALDELLSPLGFTREGSFWTRSQGGLVDQVSIQTNIYRGTTVNVYFNDENTAALLREAAPDIGGAWIANERLWSLTGDPYDRWWNKDPSGPAEVVGLLKEYGLPFLDKLHELEFQLTRCGPLFEEGRRHTWSQIWMAMTLYRLGRYDDARRVINDPSRPLSDGSRRNLEAIRRWIEVKTASA